MISDPSQTPIVSNKDSQVDAKARAAALSAALDKLEDLALGEVEKFDSYDALEAGCLSCSGVKVNEK